MLSEVERIGFDIAVGSSGTIKSIKSLAMGLLNTPPTQTMHGSVLTTKEIWQAKEALLKAKSLKERKNNFLGSIQKSRIIVAGLFVLSSITKILGIREWIISLTALQRVFLFDTILRDGVLATRGHYRCALAFCPRIWAKISY